MTIRGLKLPHDAIFPFDGVAICDDGSLVIKWSHPHAFHLVIDGQQATMVTLCGQEVQVHAHPVGEVFEPPEKESQK